MTEEEAFDWLKQNEMPGSTEYRRRWLYSDNARPFLDEMMDMGLIQFVSGEFKLMPSSGKTAELFDKTVPVETMISTCTLNRRFTDAYNSHVLAGEKPIGNAGGPYNPNENPNAGGKSEKP